MMSVFRRFVRYLRPYLGSIVLALVCAIFISICDIGYVHILAETIDALKMIETNAGELKTISVRYFYIEGLFDGFNRKFLVEKKHDAIWLVGGVVASVLILVVIKGIFTYCNDYLMARVGHKLIVRVRNELYERIVFAPFGVLKEHRTGDLMSRVTDDVRTWLNGVGATASTSSCIHPRLCLCDATKECGINRCSRTRLPCSRLFNRSSWESGPLDECRNSAVHCRYRLTVERDHLWR